MCLFTAQYRGADIADTVFTDNFDDSFITSGVDNWIFKSETDKHTGKLPGGKITAVG